MVSLARYNSLIASLGPVTLIVGFLLFVQHGSFLPMHLFLYQMYMACVLISVGGFLLGYRPNLARWPALCGFLIWLVSVLKALSESPFVCFICLILIGFILIKLWRFSNNKTIRELFNSSELTINDWFVKRVKLSSFMSLATCTWVIAKIEYVEFPLYLACVASILITSFFLVSWLIFKFKNRVKVIFIGLLFILGIVCWGICLCCSIESILCLLVIPLIGLGFVRFDPQTSKIETAFGLQPLLFNSSRLLVVTFLCLILMGTALLTLPNSSGDESARVSWINAAFTSVSAVCVTGLVVLDTPKDFSFFGQVCIMLLIQLGGLGIMTFSTAAMAAFGKRMSLKFERTMAGMLSVSDRGELIDVLKIILYVTFSIELLGTLTLTSLFMNCGDTFRGALWKGIFTSISAYCNAGFALQSDNLITYNTNAGILITISLLIICGGLSPLLIVSLPNFFRHRHIAVHYKLALLMTLCLLVGGAVSFFLFEWTNTLSHFNFVDKLSNAWFQSVTTRTAGFNSLNIELLRPTTLLLIMALMFIGGSPGSTAGGIKTTTFAVLVLAIRSAVNGTWNVTAFNRSISHKTVYKAIAVCLVGLLIVFTGTMAILLTQNMPAVVAIFEVISALGTVGLSIGGTLKLDAVGKFIIMFCMFVGRVGPLTFFLFLSYQEQKRLWTFPEEIVDVG